MGRQPWVIRGYLKTADAVTPMPNLAAPFLLFTLLYFVLGITVVFLLRAHVFRVPKTEPQLPSALPTPEAV